MGRAYSPKAVGIVAALLLLLAACGGSAHQGYAGCPYIGTKWGSPLTGSEYEWATSTLGKQIVERCWPGSHD